MNAELHAFVKDSLERGIGRDAIGQVLLQARWPEDEVRNALNAFADVDFPVPVPRPKPYLQAREAFFYIVSFIALYVTAISFGVLIFSFIDRAFPDPLDFGSTPSSYGLTTAVSAIVIAFPVYLFFMWRISIAVANNPDRRESLIRKWLIYLTLVVGAGIIGGDLIALLANFLQGELSIRFILKGLTILIIVGVIFGYYLWDIRRDAQQEKA